jgi:hypothetical protein
MVLAMVEVTRQCQAMGVVSTPLLRALGQSWIAAPPLCCPQYLCVEQIHAAILGASKNSYGLFEAHLRAHLWIACACDERRTTLR